MSLSKYSAAYFSKSAHFLSKQKAQLSAVAERWHDASCHWLFC